MKTLFMLNTPKVRMKFPDVQKIMAYSRKDAIKRLKHKKLI